eukprot:TRINITY_DN62550_c0_g1_i1.p1 TRINITY_DN62550_c0_g1~~TRINITY_DN62550_c0_g1_i1.p1  ORF type:complete len:305 (-),score=41.85 TRINITY_DN62550_c0_g1_i1:117-1031(-)
MLSSSFLRCCARDDEDGTELRIVDLTSDVMECHLGPPVHLLTTQDSLDVTMTPRMSCKGERPWNTMTDTAHQQSLKDRIMLPMLVRYPIPPGFSIEDPEEFLQHELLRIYQEFVTDLHKGMYMMQLNSADDYSDIHVQLLDDLQTLKIDEGSGCIVEFPLMAVSKVYRIIKTCHHGMSPRQAGSLGRSEDIVVVEFMRRKLAFVFTELLAAQRFLMCMELLIRRSQERRREVETAFPCHKPKDVHGPVANPMFSSFRTKKRSERFQQKAGDQDVDEPALVAPKPGPKLSNDNCLAHVGLTVHDY